MHWLPEHAYNEGFRRAAEILSDHLSRFPGDVADLTMPVMHCYRHAIELRLKHLWTVRGWLEPETERPEPPFSHDLQALWAEVKPSVSKRIPPHRGGLSEVETAELVIHELAELDPKGVSFRYHEKRNGDPSLRAGMSINLHNVATVMPKLLKLLDDAAANIVDELIEKDALRRRMSAP